MKAAGQDKIQSSLEEAQAKMEAGRQHVSEAQAKMKAAVQEKQAETQAKIDGWKSQRQVQKLEKRADRAEDYAEWAVLAAVGAIEHADLAVLEAVDARIDAESAAGETDAEAAASG